MVVYLLFIDYSTESFIPYFSKSTLPVLNNYDNTHAYIKYIKKACKLQNQNYIHDISKNRALYLTDLVHPPQITHHRGYCSVSFLVCFGMF